MTKKKKGFLDGYETYDPKTEGFGSANEWRNTFYERVGYDKAVEVVGEADPYAILGIKRTENWETIQNAYRKMAIKYHPDKNPDGAEMMKKINAAFEVLEERYVK